MPDLSKIERDVSHFTPEQIRETLARSASIPLTSAYILRHLSKVFDDIESGLLECLPDGTIVFDIS